MKMFNVDDIFGSTHGKRPWNTTEKLIKTDHVIVHTGWCPFTIGNTEAYGVGYIAEYSPSGDNSYQVEWLDQNGETRESLAWIPREYIEKVNRPLDTQDVGDLEDEDAIEQNSDSSTLLELDRTYRKIFGDNNIDDDDSDNDDNSAIDF